jgi:hypothetical protein
LEFMEQLLLLIGIHALETVYAWMFAQFPCMIGLNHLDIRSQNVKLPQHAKKTAFNVSPAKCSVLQQP